MPIDMLLSAVSVLVVAQWSSEIPEGLMNNPVLIYLLPYLLNPWKMIENVLQFLIKTVL